MGKIIDSIRKKSKLKVYETARQAYLKKWIPNIGKIVEEEDKIICYVDQKSVDKFKKNGSYNLSLYGLSDVPEVIEETITNFKLNKDVYYIFENINFDITLKLNTQWGANVTFKNCSFDKNVVIMWGDNIVFENNQYTDHCNVYYYGNCFFTAQYVKKLTFINDNVFNKYDLKKYATDFAPIFGMNINGELVEFINSNIDLCDEHPATMRVKAQKMHIKNSVINAKEIYIDSQSIECTDSSISAQSGAMIENANCDFNSNIQAPILFYNGTDLASKNKESHIVNQEEVLLNEARKKLIDKLRNLSNYCQQLNDNKTQEIKDKFNNQTIVKTLKQR